MGVHAVLILKECEIGLMIIYACSKGSQRCSFKGSQLDVNLLFLFQMEFVLTNLRGAVEAMRKLRLLSH